MKATPVCGTVSARVPASHACLPLSPLPRCQVLEDMLGAGVRPNDRTYASLIDACARAGDKALALRVYRKAQREGCAAALEVYSAAVNACVQAVGGCDTEAAMAIYADMQRCAGRVLGPRGARHEGCAVQHLCHCWAIGCAQLPGLRFCCGHAHAGHCKLTRRCKAPPWRSGTAWSLTPNCTAS